MKNPSKIGEKIVDNYQSLSFGPDYKLTALLKSRTNKEQLIETKNSLKEIIEHVNSIRIWMFMHK